MVNILYPPNLPGLAFNVVRRPKGNTAVQPHVSGREVRLGYWTYPLYEWDLTYSVLRDFLPCPNYPIFSELKRLEGFFLAMRGSLTPFFFNDPDDNHVGGQVIATTDGTTTSFLLVRTWGDPSYGATVTEPVGNIDQVKSKFYFNNILIDPSGYTFTGVPANLYITFATPPAAGVVLSASLFYNFYVRFKDDILDFEKFSGPPGAGYWTVKKLTLMSLRAPPLALPGPLPGPPPPPPPPPPPTQQGWLVTVTMTGNPDGNAGGNLGAVFGLATTDPTRPYTDVFGGTWTNWSANIIGASNPPATDLVTPVQVLQWFVEAYQISSLTGASGSPSPLVYYNLNFGGISGDSTDQNGSASMVVTQTGYTGTTYLGGFSDSTNASVTITPYP
jgi:uncharacterized protein (TIGR02217 family)